MAKTKTPDKVSKGRLVKAAKDLNHELELEPQIDTNLKVTELEKLVAHAGGLVDPKTDKVSEATLSVLEDLKEQGVIPAEETEEETAEETTPEEPAEAEAVAEEPEEVVEGEQEPEEAAEEEEPEPKPKAKPKAKAAPKVKEDDKPPTEKRESNSALADRLLKEKATKRQVIAAFTKVYKAKGKGEVDLDFVQKRAVIYMELAAKKVKV